MRKMSLITAVALISLPLLASDVELKYSGPSGQGSLIWWAPATGITNMVLTTRGVSVANFTDGYKFAISTNAQVGGDGSIDGPSGVLTITNANLAKLKVNNGVSVTNLNAANLAAGNMPIERATNLALTFGPYIGGVISTTVSNDTGAVNALDVHVASGGTLKIGTGDTIQQMVAYKFTAAIATNANGGTNVVIVTAKDMSGTTLAAYTMYRFWIGDTEYSAPAAVAGAVTVTTGTEIQEIVDKGDYWAMTGAAGTGTVTIADTPGATNYLHIVGAGGKVTTSQMKWNVVP